MIAALPVRMNNPIFWNQSWSILKGSAMIRLLWAPISWWKHFLSEWSIQPPAGGVSKYAWRTCYYLTAVGTLLMITAFPFSVKHRASKKKLCKNLTTCLKEVLVFYVSGPHFMMTAFHFRVWRSPKAFLKEMQWFNSSGPQLIITAFPFRAKHPASWNQSWRNWVLKGNVIIW